MDACVAFDKSAPLAVWIDLRALHAAMVTWSESAGHRPYVVYTLVPAP
jgi:hypothetical protein